MSEDKQITMEDVVGEALPVIDNADDIDNEDILNELSNGYEFGIEVFE